MAEALYRKYRPQVFEEVVGQEPIERTLKNAISQDKVSHAYLFCGPRGTGKTTTARLLAKALLCQHGPTPDPDGTCEDCLLVAEGVHPDVYELDAASRTGVENVREEIISRVHFAPTRGRSKVYIIDEVHMLSTAAFNALLKTLEEPPSHVVFILCTTDPQKVPETIHSRCQRFDFHRISPESMVARLGAICIAEGVEFEGEALDLIAQRAEGGLRDALTSLEQIIAFENGRVTLAGAERLLGSIDSNELVEIMAYIGKRDITNCFRWTASYVETGADLAQFARDMAEHVRNLYVMTLAGDDADLDVTETTRRQLASELAWFGSDRAARMLGVLGDLMAELKTSSNPRLAFEIALTRMVRPDSDLTLESLAERIEALERGYSAVAHVLPGDPIRPVANVPETASAPAAPGEAMQQVAAPAPVAEPAPMPMPQPTQAAVAEHVPAPAPETLEAPTVPAGSGGFPQGGLPTERDVNPAGDGPANSRLEQTTVPVREVSMAGEGELRSQPPAAAESAVPASVAPAAAQPAAQVVPSKASTLANPAALQRIWQASLSEVKRRKQAHGVLFMNVKATYDENAARLRLVFPADATFAFNAVQKPDVQDTLAEALAKAVGEPVAFSFEQESSGSASAPAPVIGRAAAPMEVAQPAAAPAPAPSTAPAPVPAAEPVAAPAPAEPPAPTPMAGAQPMQGSPAPYADTVHYEAVPYDEVPYDEMPYDEVPYDDASYGAPYEEVPYDDAPYSQQAASAPDAATSASPADSTANPGGAGEASPDDLQAMLRASFGDGVVFREA